MLRVTTLALLGLAIVVPVDRTAAQAHNPTTELIIPSVNDLPPNRIDRTYQPDRLVSLSGTGATMDGLSPEVRTPQPYAEAVARMNIKPHLLFSPATDSSGLRTNRLPKDITHLRLSFDGREYVLYVVDVTYDSKYALRHVTAAIVNEASGHARFTVDDRRGAVVATLHVADRDYRILPLDTGGQIAYRIRSEVVHS